MAHTRKNPLLAASKKFKIRKRKTESNTRQSDIESESAIIKKFDSTTQTSVNTILARLSLQSLNSDRKLDDFNSVYVKIETDEWYNTATDFYSVCAKSEQVLQEEIHPDCNKQDGFNLVNVQNEQTGCLRIDQDYTKQDVFTYECVKSEHTECEAMHQDVTRQACVNSVCVNKITTANSNAYAEQKELHYVCGKTKQSLNQNTDQSYITTNDFNSLGGIAKQYINTDTENGNTAANDHNALWDHTYSKTPENEANLAVLNSVLLIREEIQLSNVDQYCGRPTVGGETIKMDHFSSLDVNPPHMPMPVISCDSRLSLSQVISESQSHEMPLSMSSNMVESCDFSDDYFEEIFIEFERDKSKSESYPSTHLEPKSAQGRGSSRGVVQPSGASVIDNEENVSTIPLFLKPAKMKLSEKGDQVKKVKRMTKTPEKDKPENSHKERNIASCMNLEPPDNDHFLYCGECNKEFEGECPVHGPYNYIQDKQVPEEDPLKAEHTLPNCLEIKTSKIVGAGLGVFSKEELESRIMFGPYGGDIITDNHKSGYCWQGKTYKEGKGSHFVDAQNKATSNWMRYVNCAMKEADQNLVAFQYKGGIYYCTLKPVSPGEELLVWYRDELAREVGLIRPKSLLSSYSSKDSGHFKEHMSIHAEEKQYKCEECGYACNQSSILKTHMRIHSRERLYKCEECGKAFKCSGNLKTHMRIHTGERPYKCEECDYACKHKGDLKTHMMIHTGERPYKCEECGTSFKQSGHLKTHMRRIHSGERLYKCEECGYACNQSSTLKTHMRIHLRERLYKCEVCGKAFKSSGKLKIHMTIHTEERPYKCDECGYACYQSGNLKRHMKIHTGERPYKCEECGCACIHRSALKTHMMIHTGERPYKCEECDYACKQSGDLKRHMMIHSGERPYKCEVCGKAFKQSGTLKTHMRIHSGEGLYKCAECGYACNRSSTLKKHVMMIHTGEKLYKFEECGYACNQSSDLKKHMRIHTDSEEKL